MVVFLVDVSKPMATCVVDGVPCLTMARDLVSTILTTLTINDKVDMYLYLFHRGRNRPDFSTIQEE